MARLYKCPNCGIVATVHRSVNAQLKDEENYLLTKYCCHCGNTFDITISLVQPELNNSYTHVSVNGKQTNLSHLVYQWKSGNPLPKPCVIHHINGKRRDNRPGNLFLINKAHHSSYLQTSEKIPILLNRIKQLEATIYRLEHQARLEES